MGRGRPPSDDPKDVRIYTRHTEGEKDKWQAAADSQGMKLSDFIREAVNDYIDRLKKRKK